MEIFNSGQRSLDDHTPDLSLLNTVVRLKSPRYGKGYRYCSHSDDQKPTHNNKNPRRRITQLTRPLVHSFHSVC